MPTPGSGCMASQRRRLAVVVGVECHHLGQPKHNTSTEPTGRSPRSHRGCRVDGEEGRQQVDRARPIIVSESIAANEVAESVAN